MNYLSTVILVHEAPLGDLTALRDWSGPLRSSEEAWKEEGKGRGKNRQGSVLHPDKK